jgi:cytochrome c-type biogenesis protein CcmF
LVLVAYLHSSIVQERRGMLKVWNVSMASLTFLLSIYGTFLTRSGIISSVHAFAKSSIGTWFAVFMALTALAVIALIVWRRRELRGSDSLGSFVSREAAVWASNILLVGTTVVIFFLTMLPVFSELWSGNQMTAEPIQFTRATRPWFLALVLLMGIGPLVAWRKMRPGRLARLLAPHLIAGVAFAGLLFLLGAREPWSLAFLGAVAFVVGGHAFDFVRAVRLRRAQRDDSLLSAVGSLMRHHRRRYGGYLVHIGVVVSLIGIAGSGPYTEEATFENLQPGESFSFAGYELTYEGFDGQRNPRYDALVGHVTVVRPGGSEKAALRPERRLYRRTEQATTEVAVLSTVVPPSLGELARVGEDLYLIQAYLDNASGRASFQLIVHPFLNWLWLGSLLVIIGAHWAAWPSRQEVLLLFGEGVLSEQPVPARA